MRNQEKINEEIKLMELQKQAIDSAISVLKGEKKAEDFDGEDCGPTHAEIAEEWLNEEGDYSVFDIRIGDKAINKTYQAAAEKASKWDELGKEIEACYVNEDGSENEDEDMDLCVIGEKAATAFGFL